MVRARNFQGTFETHKQSFCSAFSIYMTLPFRATLVTAGNTYLPKMYPKTV